MRRRVAAAVAVAATLSVVSCSSSSNGSPQTGLQQAMASVPASAAARSYFEYGSPAALRELGVLHPAAVHNNGKVFDPTWSRMVGIGTGSLADYATLLPRDLSLNVLTADNAITIGQPPNVATRIDGAINASAVTAKLRGFGAKPRTFGGVKGLSLGADNSVNVNSKLTRKLYVLNELDQVVVTNEQFAASPNSATLQDVIGDNGTSLLDTGSYGDMADCLGDVLAAVVTDDGSDRTALFGVGVRTPASATATRHEVVCFLPHNGARSTVLAAVRHYVAPHAVDPVSDEPMSKLIAHAAVTTNGSLVRADLTMRSQTPPGFVVPLLYNRVLPYWDGSCTTRQLATRHC